MNQPLLSKTKSMIKNNKKVLLSIVTFHSNLNNIKTLIDNNIDKSIYISIFDNSQNESYICALKNLIRNYKTVSYFANNKNIGFGQAHNFNIITNNHNCYYSIILNPDILVSKEKIFALIKSFDDLPCNSCKILSPFLLNLNRSEQNFVRLFPGFVDFLYRIFNVKQINYAKKLLSLNLSIPIKVPFVHGAFYLIKTNDFVSLNGFSNNLFLYCEDLDLCSKIYLNGGDVFVDPQIKVIHLHNRASRKSLFLALIHLSSIIKYLKKYSFKFNRLKSVNDDFIKSIN